MTMPVEELTLTKFRQGDLVTIDEGDDGLSCILLFDSEWKNNAVWWTVFVVSAVPLEEVGERKMYVTSTTEVWLSTIVRTGGSCVVSICAEQK